jgi:hypothetical protein
MLAAKRFGAEQAFARASRSRFARARVSAVAVS